jgi:hypothetical protein
MSIIRTNTITNSAGTGAPDFPNGLTVNSLPIPTPIDRQVFSASGNWTKPVGAKFVFVRVWGAGGGGGSGQIAAVSTNRFGGGGGGGGAYYDGTFNGGVEDCFMMKFDLKLDRGKSLNSINLNKTLLDPSNICICSL